MLFLSAVAEIHQRLQRAKNYRYDHLDDEPTLEELEELKAENEAYRAANDH